MGPQRKLHSVHVVYKQGGVHHKCRLASCYQNKMSFCQWDIRQKPFTYCSTINVIQSQASVILWLLALGQKIIHLQLCHKSWPITSQLHLCLLVLGQTVWCETKWLSTPSVGEVGGVGEPTQASNLVWHHLVSKCESGITTSCWVLERGSVCRVDTMQVNKIGASSAQMCFSQYRWRFRIICVWTKWSWSIVICLCEGWTKFCSIKHINYQHEPRQKAARECVDDPEGNEQGWGMLV